MQEKVEKLERAVGGLRRDVDAVREAQVTHQETVRKIDERLERVWEVRREDKVAAKLDNDNRQAAIMDGIGTLTNEVKGVREDVAQNKDFITGAKAVKEYVAGTTGEYSNPLVSPKNMQRARTAGKWITGGGLLALVGWLIEMLMSFEEIIKQATQ